MSVVVDANLVAAMVLPLPYSDLATHRITSWKRNRVGLLAPILLEYEVAAILRKAVVAGLLTTLLAVEAIHKIRTLNIQCTAPTPELHRQALHWAEQFGHSKTHDAHYLALAEQSQAELWTADRRLANRARQLSLAWVYWVGESI